MSTPDNSMIGRYLQEFLETGKCGSVMASTVDFIPRLAALRREVEGLKAELASMTNESRNVPLCADHAETWFTARYFKPGDCWFCQGDKERDTALAQLAEATKERDALKSALEHWQHVWKETDCEHDDCMGASDEADKALAAIAAGGTERPSEDEIRKDHASTARHNEGVLGMPQGPCQCRICKP